VLMGGETPEFDQPNLFFQYRLKRPEADHPMLSRPSQYSSVVHVPVMVVPSQERECEWRRPRLCPTSWPTVPRDMLPDPLIQAREGLPPTVAAPEKPQPAFAGKA